MTEEIIKGLIAGLFALVPILVQSLSERRRARSMQHRVARLSNEITFLEGWAKLARECREVVPGRSLDQSWGQMGEMLDRMLSEYREVRLEQSRAASSEGGVSLIRRSLLLYRASSWKAMVVHGFFHAGLLFALLMVVAGGFVEMDEGASEEGMLMQFFYMLVGVLILFGIPLLILQQVATRMHDAAAEAEAVDGEVGESPASERGELG